MKPRIFSGIKPSGDMHIGNYLGAIKQWVEMQESYDAIFCIVDLHAITVSQDPKILRDRTMNFVKTYLAAGIDPAKATLFIQSNVSEHSELCWILNTITKNGDLTKMTQFKDKSGVDFDNFSIKSEDSFSVPQDEFSRIDDNVFDRAGGIDFQFESEEGKQSFVNAQRSKEGVDLAFRFFKEKFQVEVKEKFNSIGVGLFDYPVLMAADILLYDTAVVPVGEDQVQHVELARTLARRFNKRFGETFVIPESKVQKEGARIMGLDNPAKKMSKSASSEYNYIALMDDPEMARKKIMKAVTDSGAEILYSDEKPALKNLVNIYSLLGNISTDDVVRKYAGKGYADFKRDLADVVADFLVNFQRKFQALSDEEALRILGEGATRARAIASEKMNMVRERVGFVRDTL